MDLIEKIYYVTKNFPFEEKFGLTDQLRRCSISIASNISEGAGRNSNKQFLYFLQISMGSCNELQTQVEIAKRLKYLNEKDADVLIEEALQLYKMIIGFSKTINNVEKTNI